MPRINSACIYFFGCMENADDGWQQVTVCKAKIRKIGLDTSSKFTIFFDLDLRNLRFEGKTANFEQTMKLYRDKAVKETTCSVTH